jgi:hypothetical protein
MTMGRGGERTLHVNVLNVDVPFLSYSILYILTHHTPSNPCGLMAFTIKYNKGTHSVLQSPEIN